MSSGLLPEQSAKESSSCHPFTTRPDLAGLEDLLVERGVRIDHITLHPPPGDRTRALPADDSAIKLPCPHDRYASPTTSSHNSSTYSASKSSKMKLNVRAHRPDLRTVAAIDHALQQPRYEKAIYGTISRMVFPAVLSVGSAAGKRSLKVMANAFNASFVRREALLFEWG
jgi:hypothetical protein